MHLTGVLLLGALPLAFTVPVSHRGYSQTTSSSIESAHSKRQPQDIVTGILEGVLEPITSLDGGEAGLEGLLKRKNNKYIETRQLAVLGAFSGILTPLMDALSKRKDGGALPDDQLEVRQPIELDEVTTLLGSLSGILGTVEGLGSVLKRGDDENLANDEINAKPVIEDLERRQDPLTSLLAGLLSVLTPMIGPLTDPIAPLLGGKGWRVKRDDDIPLASPLLGEVQSSPGLAALVGEITDPISPLVGAKGYGTGPFVKKDGNLESLASLADTLRSSNSLATLLAGATDPIAPIIGGKGYGTAPLVKKDGDLEGLALLADALRSSDSLATLLAGATDPIAPIIGGKGYESGNTKRGIDPFNGLLGPLGSLLSPNALAALFAQLTNPISPLVGGHGYPT